MHERCGVTTPVPSSAAIEWRSLGPARRVRVPDRRRRARRWLVSLALVFAAFAVHAEPAPLEPAAIVEQLHTTLLAGLRGAKTTSRQARCDALLEVVKQTYDLDFMARTALGSAWRNLGPEAQRRWVAALGRLVSASLVDGFASDSGESFRFVGQRPAALGTIVVETRLLTPKEPDVQFDYRLRKLAAGWRVIDIYVDAGISEVALRRSEYTTALKSRGFEALAAGVEKRATELCGTVSH